MNRYYIKTSSKIKEEKTIFLISDLHYFEPKNIKKFEFLLEEIKNKKPDYLMMAGDLLDSAEVIHEEQFIQFIKACALETIVLIGIGNHDVTIMNEKNINYVWNEFFWKRIKSINNVFLLDNEDYETDDICVRGLTLPYEYYHGNSDISLFFEKHLKKANPNKLNILLIHASSSILDYDLKNYDLVLAGHTHNGMVPRILEFFFKNSGLISPGKKFFPKKVRGNFKIDNTDVIVSGGITKLSKRSRLDFLDCFWAHELTIIKIKPK